MKYEVRTFAPELTSFIATNRCFPIVAIGVLDRSWRAAVATVDHIDYLSVVVIE
jgi:hypothetical protein